MLERAVTVTRVVRLGLGRRRLRGGVHAALELAEHEAEQEVPPRLLGEGTPVALERRQILAGGVKSIRERAQRPRREVLGEGEGRTAHGRRERNGRREICVDGPEQDPVLHVEREAGGIPAVAARDRLAEQLDVIEAAPEGELVERLLDRPDGRGDGATDGSSQRAGAIDRQAQPQQL